MIFPFTIKYQKTIEIQTSNESIKESIKYIENFVSKKDVEIVSNENSKLTFTSSIFTGHSWSIFAPIEKGEFNIKLEEGKQKLSYEFFMYRLFVIAGIMSIFMGYVSDDIEFGFICLAWLGGMNWIIAIIRHWLMFSKIVKDINTM